MNLRSRDIVICFVAIALCLTLGGCTAESLDECDGSLEVRFSFQRQGEEMLSSEVSSISLFVFDEHGMFFERHDEFDQNAISPEYRFNLSLPKGNYSFTAWGGLDSDHYSESAAAVSMQSASAVFHNEEVGIVDYDPSDLFYGNQDSVSVTRNDRQQVVVNLIRNTKLIELTLSGLPEQTRTGAFSHLDVYIESFNGDLDFNNGTYNSERKIIYLLDNSLGDDNIFIAGFRTNRMVYGQSQRLVIRDRETSAIFSDSIDLLEDCIRKDPRYTNQQDIDQEDLFEIKVDFASYRGTEIVVNGWNVTKNESDIQ